MLDRTRIHHHRACCNRPSAEVWQREVAAGSRVPLEQLVRAALERSLAEGAVTSGQLARCQQRVSQLETARAPQVRGRGGRWAVDGG